MDETAPAGKSSELDLSGSSNDSMVTVLEAGVRERHSLEARFRKLCDVITQLGVTDRASRAPHNEENDDYNSRNRENYLRLEKCQFSQEHGDGQDNVLLASGASPRRTGPERRMVRVRFQSSRSPVTPKSVQDSDMLRGKEDRRAVSDGDDEQGVIRRVESTRRQRFDEPAVEQRESNQLSSGRTPEDSCAVVSVFHEAGEKGRPHGLAPFVSINVNVGSANASPVEQGQSSGGEPSGRPHSKNFASGVSGANLKWDDKVQRGDTSNNLAADFDTQPRGRCYGSIGREKTRAAEHSIMRSQGLGRKVQETGRSRCVREPERAYGVEELDGGLTSSRPYEDGGREVEDDHLPCRPEEHYSNNTRFPRDVRYASKALGDNQGNDENWCQGGRVRWTMDREAAARERDTISRTLRPFESSNKQDASKGRLWSHGGQPYHGLYARSLRANGLDPEHFRSSCCSRHPCRSVTGIDTAVSSERAARYHAHTPQVDKALVESEEDALAAEKGIAPTRGLQDKLEATRVWSSLNQRAELLGTMPPTPLRTKATWMAKPRNAQYSVVEGSKGLLHSFWSSNAPRSAMIRTERANVRSGCYAFGAGRQDQPPFPAAATHLMVASKNAWNAKRDAGADQPRERIEATDIRGEPQRRYLSRNCDRYPGQKWAKPRQKDATTPNSRLHSL